MEHVSRYEDDRIYRTYYQEVGQYALLSADAERDLLKRYHTCATCRKKFPQKIVVKQCPSCGSTQKPVRNGRTYTCPSCTTKYDNVMVPTSCPSCGTLRDMSAREKIAVTNLRFVVKRAVQMSKHRPHMLHTLISAGNVGLLLAIDRFNMAKNTRFLTYADWWIRKEMYDTINASSLVHIPTHKQKSLLKEQSEGRYVCQKCGCRIEHTNSTKALPPCTDGEHDFHIPLNDASGLLSDPVTIDDCTLSDGAHMDNPLIDNQMETTLRQLLASLDVSERDKFILMGYFNVALPDRKTEAKNLHQLACLTGITPERVRQIKENVLKQLRKGLRKYSITSMNLLCTDD